MAKLTIIRPTLFLFSSNSRSIIWALVDFLIEFSLRPASNIESKMQKEMVTHSSELHCYPDAHVMNTGFLRSWVLERGRRLSTCEAVKQPTGVCLCPQSSRSSEFSQHNVQRPGDLALKLSRGANCKSGSARGQSRSKGLVLGGSDRVSWIPAAPQCLAHSYN